MNTVKFPCINRSCNRHESSRCVTQVGTFVMSFACHQIPQAYLLHKLTRANYPDTGCWRDTSPC